MEIKFVNKSSIKSIDTNENSIRSKRYEYWRQFYLNNPDIFMQEILNVKLKWYQKILLKLLNVKNK